MQASLTVLDHGGPALLGYRPGTHTPYAIGSTDDQGIYVIVPVLSHWLGVSDPLTTLRWLWLAAWTSTLLFSATVCRSLFKSRWAALLVPPALLVCIFSFGFEDIYWVTAWITVTFMPLLVLLTRRRPRGLLAALMLIALVAGVVTAIRSQAGLPVALGTAAVALATGRRWWLRVIAATAVIAAYLLPMGVVLPAIREHRDHRIGVDLRASEPTSHPLWHTVYVGLGYTPNRYRIHYDDSYGLAAAEEQDPGVRYLSPAYASALHRQVDALIDHDPWFVAKTEGEKALVELSHAGRYILLLLLLLPTALSASGAARLRRWELALFLPAVMIGALPAIIAIPFRSYELSLLAPLGTLGLLAIGSVAARAETEWHAVSATAGPRDRTRRLRCLVRTWPQRSTLRTLLIAVAVLAPILLFARHLEAQHERWDLGERHQPTVVLAGGAPPGRSS